MNQARQLHLHLLGRLVVVAAVVSVAVGALVVYNESARLKDVAKDRAFVRIGTLRVMLLDRLDAGDLSDDEAVAKALKTVAYKGIKVSTGHYVLIRILGPTLQEIARSTDPSHAGIEALETYVGASTPMAPPTGEPQFDDRTIGERSYIHSVLPLADSQGHVAAWAEGFFSTSPAEDRAAWHRLLVALGVAVGTVLATTALLYPIILQLLHRLARLSVSLLDSNLEMLQVIGRAIAKRDSDTDAHNYRVTILSTRIGEALGLDDATMRSLVKGALLHDVGKIGITDSVLLKPGRLDETEFGVMKQHVKHGLDIVNRSAWLKDSAAIVGGHHEKFDGSGYYQGLKGDEIPFLARIFTVADVFDAVTSHRPYHTPMGFDDAMNLLAAGRGTHFDPAIIDVFGGIARPLFDTYADRDDEGLRSDYAVILQRYYKTDLTAFMS